ncbi:MAG: hypothetical protein EBR02_02960 [Alphaproteobacteria bacterium]|nr:hypothetical protein [Alphaproteobacteria bacterium]
MRFTQAYARRSGKPIHFIRCRDDENRERYYFLMCEKQKLELLRTHSQGSRILDLADYGTILLSGFGNAVSEADKQTMLEKYDIDVTSYFN